MITVQARIQNIRSRGKYGGAIASAQTEEQEKYVFIISNHLLPDSNDIQRGQIWKVYGSYKMHELKNDFGVINEKQINAQKAEMILPSGDNIISFISENKQIEGIGYVKARKLYEHFGDKLVDIIESNDINQLIEFIPSRSAELLCEVFAKNKTLRTLQWLDKVGVELSVAQKVSKFYGPRTQIWIEDNPYRLLSFCSKWKIVDELAQKKFGIQEADERRLAGAIQECLYMGLKGGSTALVKDTLNNSLRSILGPSALVDKALSLGMKEGQYYKYNDLYMAAGTWLIEKNIAKFIIGRTNYNTSSDKNKISEVISVFQQEEGYLLTDAQAQAVMTSANNSFSFK
jgi:exodeoxyribonuclease V alpha subunit